MQSITKLGRSRTFQTLRRFIFTKSNIPWRTAYGGRYTVTLIHGDGVGPELMEHVKTTVRSVRAPIDFEDIIFSNQSNNEDMLERAILAVKRNGVALKGNISSKNDSNSLNVLLRTRLDLFASVVRCKSSSLVKTRHSDIDIIVIRENTEGEYSSLEHQSVPGVVESLKIITEEKSTKLARFAFDLAKTNQRKKVTAVHKANIMKLSDGLFLQCCRQVARDYPEIEFETMIVDNTCMQLVNRPNQFDVMIMPNLYGNIISNICAGLIGGAGFVAGSNYGSRYAIFEQGTRNSGSAIAGKNLANPAGILFATANLLKYLGLEQHGTTIKLAILNTIEKHQIRTSDIGGTATTTFFMDHLIKEIEEMTPELGFPYVMQATSSQSNYQNID